MYKQQKSNTVLLSKKFAAAKEKTGYEVLKRIFDIVLSFAALIILSPVFLIVSAAIKIEDGGPVFFIQTRLTKHGKTFSMYKFRSMYTGAESELSNLIDKNEMTGPVFKIRDDPRVTAVGRFIRRTSIDELPQLVNILQGYMSVVGPRPPLPQEVKQYTNYQMHRLDVKTGLACYHECYGRNLISDFDQWVEMDLQYIRERSLWTDLKIIIRTIQIVLTGKGAR